MELEDYDTVIWAFKKNKRFLTSRYQLEQAVKSKKNRSDVFVNQGTYAYHSLFQS